MLHFSIVTGSSDIFSFEYNGVLILEDLINFLGEVNPLVWFQTDWMSLLTIGPSCLRCLELFLDWKVSISKVDEGRGFTRTLGYKITFLSD